MGLNVNQIRMVQIAARTAGLRGKGFDGRYRMMLGRYKQPSGKQVDSCKQLNNWQMEDFLAICESLGWQCPSKSENHFRQKASRHNDDVISFAQKEAVGHLAGDLGWGSNQIDGMAKRITQGKCESISTLSRRQAYNLIEALKNILSRQTGNSYANLNEVKEDMEAKDGSKQTSQV